MFAASKSGGGAVPTDPDFEYVTLLLPGNGTNGATNNTFIDSSTNSFTVTRVNRTTQGSVNPFGTLWSNYFDGTNAFLTVGNTGAAGALSTGNFTVECWVNIASNTAIQIIVDARGQNQIVAWQLYTSATGKVVFQYGAGTITGATTVSIGVWTHIAVVRSGSAITLYVNGVSDGTATSSADISGGSTFYVGRTFDTSGTIYYSGYISNLRVVIGSAVYTTGFTPSTVPLTAITNTALLTCQSNRFVDNSTNAFDITVSGGSSVQRFSPFSPSVSYAAATVGGSGYFGGPDGVEYLTVPDNAAFNFGSGDFTIEAWVYVQPGSSLGIVGQLDSSSSYTNSCFDVRTSGTVFTVYVYYGSSYSSAFASTLSGLSSWHHVAAVRNGTSLKMYVDGKGGTSTNIGTTTLNNSTQSVMVGALNSDSPGFFYKGFMTDLRIVKGTAVYTADFTPPTAPLTAISGTSLLLSYTNGAVLDAAQINDGVTGGNTQISTTQSKFGGGSMYFDGASGSAIVFPNSPAYGYGTGNFTIEFWLYVTTASGPAQIIFDQRASTASQIAPTIYFNSSGSIVYFVNGADRITATYTPTSAWAHVAVARSGTSTKMFVNGTQVGSTYTDTNNYLPTPPIFLGTAPNGLAPLTGYIDDLRITNGVARYTANFTPPSAPFPTK